MAARTVAARSLFALLATGAMTGQSTAVMAATTYVYMQINVPGATATSASDINSSNQIVGWYVDGGGATHGDGKFTGTMSPIRTAILEPGTLALLGIAFAGLAWRRQKL